MVPCFSICLGGYGYKPLRFLYFYLLAIVGFAAAYLQLTNESQSLGLPETHITHLILLR